MTKLQFSPRTIVRVLPAVLALLHSGAVSAESTSVRRDDLSAFDLVRVREVTRRTDDFSKAEPHEALQGGAGTFRGKAGAKSFASPVSGMSDDERLNFSLGHSLFKKLWTPAPSSTQASDGLGPLFNARSCETCHQRGGGGHPPGPGEAGNSFMLRLARPAVTEAEKAQIANHEVLNFPDPVYGYQLQDQAITGLKGEARIRITYSEKPVTLSGGEIVKLRVPRYELANLAYGPLDPKTTLSPRIAQTLPGMGLLEAIADADILASADPDDENGDGISGRANMVADPESGKTVLGRFGWKAEKHSVREQTAAAAFNDIGISTPLHSQGHGDCTKAQTACLDLPTGEQARLGKTEAPDPVLDLMTFYTANLALPARRNVSAPNVLAGKKLFYDIGCTACHTPKFVTRRDTKEKANSFQLIWPYSDMLLHDMGNSLADGQSVGDAKGQDWRTSPLWGIGLRKSVNETEAYLHDGRARTLTEAIVWHGGEAQKARDAFVDMDALDRRKLLDFLESL